MGKPRFVQHVQCPDQKASPTLGPMQWLLAVETRSKPARRRLVGQSVREVNRGSRVGAAAQHGLQIDHSVVAPEIQGATY